MRILIVEDDPTISSRLKKTLEDEAFAVDTANDGYTGSFIARTNNYDLVALDLMLPRKNGDEILRDIRSKTKDVPVLIMSQKNEVDEKVTLLRDADDYIVKPFATSEFVARVKAILRRPHEVKSSVITLGDLTIDTSAHKVTRANKDIFLTRKEMMLLECLAGQRGKVISRGEIMEKVWNHDSDPFSNTIEAHIRNIRRKIDFGKTDLIQTISGRGYKIE
jgi:DNA-binding response OmpR family regulator